METPENPIQYDMTVSYTCDQKTGKINLTIEYNSPPGTWPDDHERQHRELVQRLLDESGILGPDSGEMCVRVRRADVELVYYITRVEEKLVWRLDSQRQIVEPSPQPSPPLPTPVPVENKIQPK